MRGYFRWDSDALDALAAKLESAGIAVKREPASVADHHFVRGAAQVRIFDPVDSERCALETTQLAERGGDAAFGQGGARTGRYSRLDSTMWLCSSTVRLSMRSANSLDVWVSCVFCSSIRVSNTVCSAMLR